MSKIINISDKLDFESKHKLIIKDVEIEVKADAKTMLKVMSLVKDDTGAEEIIKAYEYLFDKENRDKLDALNLSFKDLTTVITYAVKLIQGEDVEGGN